MPGTVSLACLLGKSRPSLAASLALALWASAARAQPAPLGGEFRVNTGTQSNETTPAVAMDAAGNFVVIWEKFNPARLDGQLYLSDGTPQGGEFLVKQVDTLNRPALSRDADGDFVVAWDTGLGAITDVFGQRYDSAGGPVGAEFQANTVHTSGGQGSPSAVMRASGEFLLAWDGAFLDADLSQGVEVKRYDGSGSAQGSEFTVNSYGTDDQVLPAVAVDGAGNFVVVWQSGRFAQAEGQDGSGYGIFGQRYDSAGTALGGEFQVNVYTTGSQTQPQVSMRSSGEFVVVWCGVGQGTVGRRYDSAGGALDSEFQVSSTTSCQGRPVVAIHEAGAFVVVWQSDLRERLDGSGSGVFGRSFDGAGTPQGPEFQVNTYTTLDQGFPALALGPAGDFVVVWSSRNQDGASDGVFGQRFSLTPLPTATATPTGQATPTTTATPTEATPAATASPTPRLVGAFDTRPGPSRVGLVLGMLLAAGLALLAPRRRRPRLPLTFDKSGRILP
jgi:hypothetical protein